MAFYPTQKSTYDRLQKSRCTKHACGRPGINGGYIANPNVRFGVNCYGVKPNEPVGWVPSEIKVPPSESTSTSPVPNDYQNKLNKMKKQAIIKGFNNKEWSRY